MPMVIFSKVAVQDPQATTSAGRPVFGDGIEALVQIDKYSNIKFQWLALREGEARDVYFERIPNEVRANFLRELEAWESGQAFIDGTPLDAMPWLTPAQIANLQGVGLNTVEKLAAASDGVIGPLGMNASTLRNQAKAWLDDRAGSVVGDVGRLTDENAALREQFTEQAKMLADMRAQLDAMRQGQDPDGSEKRGPGRPKNSKE